MTNIEIWKDIPNYEGLYQVSNLGRVKSFRRQRETILNPFLKKGYYAVELRKKTFRVHQLVAVTFLGHKINGMEIVVDHIDDNKLNNNVDNLQLLSNHENCIKRKNRRSIKKSNYNGVSWDMNANKWRAKPYIKNFKKSIHLGLFDTEESAYISVLNTKAFYYGERTKRISATDKS